jgi:hypothetical protein
MKRIQQLLTKIIAYSDEMDKVSNTEGAAQVSKILIGALIGVNLIVFQALLSISPVDSYVETSLTALSFAIPTSGGFLFIRFLQEQQKVQGYGSALIKFLAMISIGTTSTGIYEAIAHISMTSANVFFLTTLAVTIIIGVNNRQLIKNRRKEEEQKRTS